MGIGFLSARTVQVELEAGLRAVLDLRGMPKHIDGCFMQRRDARLSGVNAAFRQSVLDEGAQFAACRTS
jgi:hypothetical protein